MKKSCSLIVLTLAAVLMAVTIQFAIAQDRSSFPNHPIELIIPYSPGGGSGITGEIMRKIVSDEKLSPQPLTLTYKPGAGGLLGWTYLSNRKGSGYSIATATTGFAFGLLSGQTQLKLEDFTPIAVMLMDTQLIVTYPNSPYKTMKDVIEASRKNPNSVKVGATGAIGPDATVAGMIESSEKIKLNVIPFMSGGEAMTAIMGGHVDLAISNPNELAPQIFAGKLRPLAVFSEQRLADLPNVPTMKEMGYNVTFPTPRGVLAPAGIPKAEEEYLIGLMKRITESKAWAEYAKQNMMSVAFIGGADYAKFLTEQRAQLAAILKSMGK